MQRGTLAQSLGYIRTDATIMPVALHTGTLQIPLWLLAEEHKCRQGNTNCGYESLLLHRQGLLIQVLVRYMRTVIAIPASNC